MCPRYIDYIKDGKFTHSLGVILQKYPMAATCGAGMGAVLRNGPGGGPRWMRQWASKCSNAFVADREKYITNEWFSSYPVAEKMSDDLKVAVTGPATLVQAMAQGHQARPLHG